MNKTGILIFTLQAALLSVFPHRGNFHCHSPVAQATHSGVKLHLLLYPISRPPLSPMHFTSKIYFNYVFSSPAVPHPHVSWLNYFSNIYIASASDHVSSYTTASHLFFFFFKISFLERGKGREKERERNINLLLLRLKLNLQPRHRP